MTLDEQKEVVAKNICSYVADLIKSSEVKTVEAAYVMNFLVTRMEKATDESALKSIALELKQEWPTLHEFNSGI